MCPLRVGSANAGRVPPPTGTAPPSATSSAAQPRTTTVGTDPRDFSSSNLGSTYAEPDALDSDIDRLGRLERDIKAHQDAVKKLLKEKNALLKKIGLTKSATSWIGRLPTEILETIFLNAKTTDSEYAPIRVSDAPMVLLRVCKAWRDLALKMPQLWSSMDITVPATVATTNWRPSWEDTLRKESFEEEVDRWLERSGDQPLTIRIREGRSEANMMPRSDSGILHNTILKLRNHAYRWESLDFEIMPELLQAFRANLPVPRLKRVRIVQHDWDSEQQARIFGFRSPFNAPLLQELIIVPNTLFQSTILLNMPVNWANLTGLAFSQEITPRPFVVNSASSTVVSLLPIFARCTNLRQCHITLPKASVSPQGSPSVALPSLKALSLEGCCQQLELFLTYVDTPVLNELHYYPAYDIFEHTIPAFFNLLNTYGSQIEALGFDLPAMTNGEFLSSLGNLPNLRSLNMGQRPNSKPSHPLLPRRYPFDEPEGPFTLSDSHLRALTPRRGEETLTPKLQFLRCNAKTDVTPEVVMDFLRAKTDAALLLTGTTVRLEQVFLTRLQLDWPFSEYFSSAEKRDEEDDPFEEFRESGVSLHLTKSPALAAFKKDSGLSAWNGPETDFKGR